MEKLEILQVKKGKNSNLFGAQENVHRILGLLKFVL